MVDFSRLKAVLAAEMGLLEELVELEEKTVQILVEGNSEALQKANLQKEALVEKMKEMEKQRRLFLPSGVTLKEICRRENPPEAEELENIRKRILKLHSSLQRLLKVNRHLLKHNLQFVEYALNILLPQEEGPLYASSGQLKERLSSATRLLDSNA